MEIRFPQVGILADLHIVIVKWMAGMPTTGENIESGENNISGFSIQSVTGQDVIHSNVKAKNDETISLDINHLPNGIYFLRTTNDKGETMVSKIVKR